VDRLTRKELKTDKFALEVEHGVEYVAEHKQQVARYAGIAIGAVVLIVAIYAFMQYRSGVREDALRAALKVQDAQVGAGAPPSEAVMTFPTQADKDVAVQKALSEVAGNYAGSEQGEIARYVLATNATDKGDLATAAKDFQEVIDKGNKNYASLAKLSLASIYKSQGKTAEGEKLLRDVVANPTMFVSKEQATIALGQYLASYNPTEARKLMEPLRTERGAVSRAALSALSEIPQK
jgi:predicted negative regulator of RcsB-dependent stress response